MGYIQFCDKCGKTEGQMVSLSWMEYNGSKKDIIKLDLCQEGLGGLKKASKNFIAVERRKEEE